MRSVNLTFVAFILVSSLFAQHYHDKPATHGMLLMGSETIYASHLPMFHSPHDYQVILKLKFDLDGDQKYTEDRKAHAEELVYTIEPEEFVLPEMVNRTKKFKSKVYRGHFERGGVMIAEDVTVTIEQVIYFNQFRNDAMRPAQLKYILFGNSKEQFLAHLISARPDFDEVIAVTMESGKTEIFKKSAYKIIEFNENDVRSGFSWKTNSAKFDKDGAIEFTQHQQLYFELGDLK